MSEQALQAAVIQLCRMLGIHWYHVYDPRRTNKGWPDLALYRSRMIYRELKTRVGKVTDAQAQCGANLQQAGQDWAIWRPEDLQSGRILRELRAIL